MVMLWGIWCSVIVQPVEAGIIIYIVTLTFTIFYVRFTAEGMYLSPVYNEIDEDLLWNEIPKALREMFDCDFDDFQDLAPRREASEFAVGGGIDGVVRAHSVGSLVGLTGSRSKKSKALECFHELQAERQKASDEVDRLLELHASGLSLLSPWPLVGPLKYLMILWGEKRPIDATASDATRDDILASTPLHCIALLKAHDEYVSMASRLDEFGALVR